MTFVFAAALAGASLPALAQSAGSEFSMQRALFVARNIGIAGISQIEFYDGKWQIEGHAPDGQNIEVEIDAETGAIMNVDRWW
ncbi:MAG TPA: PepSY domain-containing protein [Pseudorhodoplanes sp.]|jgi:hypothetical protein|nr:PepSY domain-containing protein [Pseudorhodoplanes sp.]